MTHVVGVVGLGVMGRNLARNIAGKGFPVAGYDLDPAKRTDLSTAVTGAMTTTVDAPDALAAALERPRKILMMVPAGPAVDDLDMRGVALLLEPDQDFAAGRRV